MVAAFVFAATAPAVAQAQAEPPGWGGGAASWGTAVERVLGWLDGLWSAVAGSETEPLPPEDGGDGIVLLLDGDGENSTDGSDPTKPKAYPGYDPDG
jgi:hypothetical protein